MRMVPIGLLLMLAVQAEAAPPTPPPNVVLFFADDLGYGDLACYGNKVIRTPNLDGLAKQGRRFTDFYVSQPVCSASRAALLTGCYSNRLGIHQALAPSQKIGLHPEETTIAEVMKGAGYATAILGKWHLGHLAPHLPGNHGFDTHFGLPYSNDMWSRNGKNWPVLPLLEDGKVIEPEVTPAIQATLTEQYTARAEAFVTRQAQAGKPFF
ncbi:MAG: sulfatase-like hydrolase/transferase, partial [Gemmataceae bacterium]